MRTRAFVAGFLVAFVVTSCGGATRVVNAKATSSATTEPTSLPAIPSGSGTPRGPWTVVSSGVLPLAPKKLAPAIPPLGDPSGEQRTPWQLWRSPSTSGGVCIWLDIGLVYSNASHEGLDKVAACNIHLGFGLHDLTGPLFIGDAGSPYGAWVMWGAVADTITDAQARFKDGTIATAKVVSGTFVLTSSAGAVVQSMRFSRTTGKPMVCSIGASGGRTIEPVCSW
jgi:hypothetical protein